MKTDGLFTLHTYKIKCKNSDPVHLVFFGDVHRDSPSFSLEHWRASLDRIRSLKNCYLIGMGDYLDSTSSSERECLGTLSARMHDTFKKDLRALAAAKVDLIASELKSTNAPIIGLINGNHYFQFDSGINSDMLLCSKLGCKYLGVSSFIGLTFDFWGRYRKLDLWCHHGAGAARLPGGSLNRCEQMREAAECDVYCMGHDHKRGIWPASPRLRLGHSSRSGPILQSRQQWLVRSGSFLKSYEPGQTSYNVDAARGPSPLGHVELHITYSGRLQHNLEIHSWS